VVFEDVERRVPVSVADAGVANQRSLCRLEVASDARLPTGPWSWRLTIAALRRLIRAAVVRMG
jgi:hypothetical protein